MMLQIDHRESHDVDFFLHDPQWLAFLDPEKHDFNFEIPPSDYTGDGTGFLKFVFADIGQIDFIIAQPKTAEPVTERVIEDVTTRLETIPAPVAKKIVYRGSAIQPRDIFDIAAASEKYADALVAALSSYTSAVDEAIKSLRASKFRIRKECDLGIGHPGEISSSRRYGHPTHKRDIDEGCAAAMTGCGGGALCLSARLSLRSDHRADRRRLS